VLIHIYRKISVLLKFAELRKALYICSSAAKRSLRTEFSAFAKFAIFVASASAFSCTIVAWFVAFSKYVSKSIFALSWAFCNCLSRSNRFSRAKLRRLAYFILSRLRYLRTSLSFMLAFVFANVRSPRRADEAVETSLSALMTISLRAAFKSIFFLRFQIILVRKL